jgi:PEP-CTERM motif
MHLLSPARRRFGVQPGNTKIAAALASALTMTLAGLTAGAQAAVVYDSTPAVVPANLASQPYQAQSTFEFGDHVKLAGTERQLQTVTMTMSNWAYQSIYLGDARYGGANQNNAGYMQNLTANFYSVNTAGAVPTLGALLTTITQATLIPWRAEPSAACPGIQWLSAEGCKNGVAFNVSFDFSTANITLPDNVIFSMAMNTQNFGANPVGSNGPYNSLNFALNSGTSVGTDADNAAVFWHTSNASFLTTGTAGVFGQDRDTGANGWIGYTPAFQITAVPEPQTYTMALLGLAAIAAAVQRRRPG